GTPHPIAKTVDFLEEKNGAQRRNPSRENLTLFSIAWAWSNSSADQQKYQQNISVDWFGSRTLPIGPTAPYLRCSRASQLLITDLVDNRITRICQRHGASWPESSSAGKILNDCFAPNVGRTSAALPPPNTRPRQRTLLRYEGTPHVVWRFNRSLTRKLQPPPWRAISRRPTPIGSIGRPAKPSLTKVAIDRHRSPV
uniref:hypothetical protein n=1 Tax=Mesorhizobium amorphae TaxID=71433 RepID=UPI001AEE4891